MNERVGQRGKRRASRGECRLYVIIPVVGAVEGSRAWRIGDTARSSTTGAGVGRAGGVAIATAASMAGWWCKCLLLCWKKEGGRREGGCQGVWAS